MKYSVLFSGAKASAMNLADVKDLLKQGYKVLLFFDTSVSDAFLELKKQCGYFFTFKSTMGKLPSLCIEDGLVTDAQKDDFDKLCQACPDFNVEQYRVEHFSTEKNLIVKASAGTGKTTVMIDRIMFLLAMVEDITPRDICMITFTNKAADNMRTKLHKKLMERYKFSGNFKYLELMECLTSMDISTIDSFFNKILKSESSQLGYGQDVNIRSFIYEKQQIVIDEVNRLFARTAGDYNEKFVLQVHEYVDLVTKCWNTLNSRGYYADEIEKMDFGKTSDDESKIINTNLKKLILASERSYQELKLRYNAITISDLKAGLDNLTHTSDKIDVYPYKYIFIDEFQDTDNSQIHSVAWLQRLLGSKIFVVGDVKQSIYRFRGAEESSFENLQECLKERCSIDIEYLTKNYRTAGNIMKSLNHVFRKWADKGLLKLDDCEDAIPTLPDSLDPTVVLYEDKNLDQDLFIEYVIDALKWQEGRRAADKQADTSVCVLVRANWEAKKVAGWLRERKIPVLTSVEGGFYQTRAVQDMRDLLGAILYPESPLMMFNYLHTSYSRYLPAYSALSDFDGDEQNVLAYLNRIAAREDWNRVLDDARKLPFFQLIRELIQNRKPAAVYAGRRRKELMQKGFAGQNLEQQLKYDVEFYELNLNKLMEKFSVSFAGDFATLLAAYDYLVLMSDTNDEDDAVNPEIDQEDKGFVVQVSTVHKAKGLEYSTVIVPFTNMVFYKDEQWLPKRRHEIITIKEKTDRKMKVGWIYKLKKVYKNSYYEQYGDIEKKAITREELRILYVALTRTKHNLVCFNNESAKRNTWGYYLQSLD